MTDFHYTLIDLAYDYAEDALADDKEDIHTIVSYIADCLSDDLPKSGLREGTVEKRIPQFKSRMNRYFEDRVSLVVYPEETLRTVQEAIDDWIDIVSCSFK